MSDRHIRRTGDDYAQSLLALLPQGPAWSRDISSTLVKVCTGLAGIFGFVDSRAADLLERESDPRKTMELLPDWERNWGLPEECFPGGSTVEERRATLMLKMTLLGGQSREFFYTLQTSSTTALRSRNIRRSWRAFLKSVIRAIRQVSTAGKSARLKCVSAGQSMQERRRCTGSGLGQGKRVSIRI